MILRKRSKLSKKELAEMIGVSVATLSSYENGKTIPSAEMAVKLALALNVSINDLISLTDKKLSNLNSASVCLDMPDDELSDYKQLLDECNEILKNKIISLD